jgi:hypothetical protein
VIFTHAIVWVLKSEKIGAGGRTTFGTGVAIPFVVLPPASRMVSRNKENNYKFVGLERLFHYNNRMKNLTKTPIV